MALRVRYTLLQEHPFDVPTVLELTLHKSPLRALDTVKYKERAMRKAVNDFEVDKLTLFFTHN